MATITTIAANDLIADSRADINTNFSNLNSDKIETSVIDTDTTLSADSNSNLPSQKAVKTYVDTQIAIAAPTGAVIPYAGSSAPTGWLLAYGQAVSRTTYATLFGVISTTYGVGDGSTTFNLPDLRGRVPAGLDNLGGSSANTITNAAADSLGGGYGSETHTLTEAEMPAHTHGFSGGFRYGGTPNNYEYGTGGSASDNQTKYSETASVGSGTSHNNVQPTLFISYIIKT